MALDAAKGEYTLAEPARTRHCDDAPYKTFMFNKADKNQLYRHRQNTLYFIQTQVFHINSHAMTGASTVEHK